MHVIRQCNFKVGGIAPLHPPPPTPHTHTLLLPTPMVYLSRIFFKWFVCRRCGLARKPPHNNSAELRSAMRASDATATLPEDHGAVDDVTGHDHVCGRPADHKQGRHHRLCGGAGGCRGKHTAEKQLGKTLLSVAHNITYTKANIFF